MKHLSVWLVLCIAVPVCAARTVTDQLGRTIQVPEHPHRLVCLMPSVVDDVYALGAGADVIAVTDYTKYPAEARTKPSVGSILAPSMETILSLHPDLVLGSADMSHTETLQQLERLGVVVFMISTHGVDGIYQSIASLGQALNREDSARELIARLRGREAAVRRQVKGKPVVSILMPVGYNPIVTIGKHAFITELIEIAGGRSVTERHRPGVAPNQSGSGVGAGARSTLADSRIENVDREDSRAARLGQFAGCETTTGFTTWTTGSIFPARSRSMHWRS